VLSAILGDSFRDDALQQKNAAIENLSRGLDDWLLSRVSEVLQLSRIPLFESPGKENIQSYMTDWQDTLSFLYDDLYLVESDGRWWSATGRTGILDDKTYLDRFFKENRLFSYARPPSLLWGHILRQVRYRSADFHVGRKDCQYPDRHPFL
jgi:hypothetical protein